VTKQEFAFDTVKDLIAATKFPTFTTSMGKGATDETLPTFGGIYDGIGTVPEVKKAVESADVLLWIGRFSVSLYSRL
jgi:pyruvate decarboxylase